MKCAFSALTLLVGRQEGHLVCKKTEWWGAGVVICLERGADLHMAQLMPLPLTVSCFSRIQIGFTFLVLAHLGSPGKGAVKRVCVSNVAKKYQKNCSNTELRCVDEHILASVSTSLRPPSASPHSKLQDFPGPCTQISRTNLIFQDFPGPGNFKTQFPAIPCQCSNMQSNLLIYYV